MQYVEQSRLPNTESGFSIQSGRPRVKDTRLNPAEDCFTIWPTRKGVEISPRDALRGWVALKIEANNLSSASKWGIRSLKSPHSSVREKLCCCRRLLCSTFYERFNFFLFFRFEFIHWGFHEMKSIGNLRLLCFIDAIFGT